MRQIRKVSPGERFGRLVTVSRSAETGKPAMWLCRCDCGAEHTLRETALTRKGTKSCGCLSRDLTRERGTKHGMAHTPEYDVWVAMVMRCKNPQHPNYPGYGGRGIRVCERWRNSFSNFLEDMGARPTPEHSIDRVDNDGNYEPSNCRWATRKEQQNNLRNNSRLTHDGETLTINQWAERTGIAAKTIESRMRSGWSVADTLTHPLIPHARRKRHSPKNKSDS